MYDVHEEYKINEEFRNYVGRCCKNKDLKPEDALEHKVVFHVGESYYEKRVGNSKGNWKQNMMNKFTEVR